MAIRKNIEAGAVLWKETETHKALRYDPETRRHHYEDVVFYYLIKLDTRRARTRGHVVTRDMVPFYQSIRVRLNTTTLYTPSGREDGYIAVGTGRYRVSEEEYNNTEVDEEAYRWYNKLKNQDVSILLEKRNEHVDPMEIIQEMRQQAEESEDDSSEQEWPSEPEFREYQMDVTTLSRFSSPSFRW